MPLIKEVDIEREESLLFHTVQNTLRLSRNKISQVEVFIKKTIGISVNVRNGIVENIEFNSDGGLFITVYNRFSKGSVSSKDFTSKGIENMLNRAIHISKYTSSDFFSGLPDIQLLYSQKVQLDLFHPWKFNIKTALEMVHLSEQTAFKYDKRIVNSEGSFFNSYINIIVFGNSLGMLETYKSTCHSLSTCVIARETDAMQRDLEYSIARKIDDLESSEQIGTKTAFRAISRLGSRKIKTKKAPIIFSAAVASSLFSCLIPAISGVNIYQKSTFLINDLQKKIFPEWLNIEEKPHIKKGLASKPFDNEGVATYTKNIIKNGVLQTWLLNSYIARKLGQISTGNSGNIYNWIVTYNNLSFNDLLKEMNNGLLVTEMMGQGVDIISGNYSRGAVGFWIENGSILYPVHEITISGNLREMWQNIIRISNDIDTRQKIRCGSVFLSEMQISGE